MKVFLQRWDPSNERWVWEATGATSSQGYVNFTPKHKADYRLGTWASSVTSNWVNAEPQQVLRYLNRWPSNRNPVQHTDLELYALARDTDNSPIEGARAEFAWKFGTGTYRETVYTDSSGVATSKYNIGNAPSDRRVWVDVWITHRGKTIYKYTSFTPE